MVSIECQLYGHAAQLYENHTVPTGAGPVANLLLVRIALFDTDRVFGCGPRHAPASQPRR